MAVLQKSIFCVVVGGILLTLTGCGRKGDPLPPQGAEPFPRQYPAPDEGALPEKPHTLGEADAAFKTDLERDEVGL